MHKVETTSRGSPQRFIGETRTNGVLLWETFITLHFEWLTLWLPRAPNGALKMPGLISHVVPHSTQQPQRSYPVYFAHVLTSVLIYILLIFIASCTDITTTKMTLSCANALVRAATCLVGASFWSSQFL